MNKKKEHKQKMIHRTTSELEFNLKKKGKKEILFNNNIKM